MAGLPAGAAAVPATATKLDPAVLEQLEEAGGMYRKGGKSRLKQAATILSEILTNQPNHPDGLLLNAQVQLELHNPEEALASATKCTQVATGMADCWLTIGVLQQDAKHNLLAAEAYDRYLDLAPKGAFAGQVRKQLKRLQ